MCTFKNGIRKHIRIFLIKLSKSRRLSLSPENKALQKLIVPLVIEQAVIAIAGLVNTVLATQMGESVVSGVALAWEFNLLIGNFLIAFSVGGTVVISRFLARDQMKEARQTSKLLYVIMAALSLILTSSVLLLRQPLLRFFFGSISSEITKNALILLIYYMLSSPLMAIHYAGAAAFRAAGNTGVPMLLTVIANALFTAGGAVLVLGFNYSIHGLGISLIFSRVLLAGFTIFLQSVQDCPVRLLWKERHHLELKVLGQILGIGIPTGLESSFFQLGRMFTVSYIALFGVVHITANILANTVATGFALIPGNAMVLAMITVAGRSAGEKDPVQTKRYTKKLIVFTMLLHALTNLIILSSLPWIISVYRLSANTAHIFSLMLILSALPEIFIWPVSFVLPSTLRAVGESRYTLFVSAFSMLICRIAGGYMLSVICGLGALGIWIAMLCDWMLRAICFSIRFTQGKWKATITK